VKRICVFLLFCCLVAAAISVQSKPDESGTYDSLQVFLEQWPVQDPDTHEIWEISMGVYSQSLTCNDHYWNRTIDHGTITPWDDGALFSSLAEQAGRYVL
jgi:hypothetical protein